ncbi:hypothetical protein BKA56DRAFT_667745 [Ilyonectria sp. MPI-CAGE-AT-0026]|nr:hypothetical protein BKA56DRAFT_667745 [Ilyonectria sp. MPI-CAGE-AT-0026]
MAPTLVHPPENEGGLNYGPPPIMRLQVWYHTKLGMSTQLSQDLAKFLCQQGGVDWTFSPTLLTISAEQSRNTLVPLEVDLEYKASSHQDAPYQNLRVLFKRTIVPSVRIFFQRLSDTPQFINIYPDGEQLTAEIKQAYTFYHIERSMVMSYKRTAQSVALEQDPLDQTIRRIGAAAPTVVARSSDILVAVNQFSHNLLTGSSPHEEWACIKELFSVELKDKERSERVPRYVNPETRELWGSLFATTTCFQGLVHDMHAIISKPSTGTNASNQDIFGVVSQMTAAVQLLSDQRAEMENLRKLLIEKYDDDTPLKERWWQFACAVLVSSFAAGTGQLAGTSPLTTCVVAGLCGLSGLATGYALTDQYGLEKKKQKVSRFVSRMEHLQESMEQAQIAFSALFCKQVLKIPLELMPRSEQKETLALLGVDIVKLGNQTWTDESIMFRVEKFAAELNDIEKLRQEVGKDAGLRDANAITTDQSGL